MVVVEKHVNVGVILGQRQRRWPSIKPALTQCPALAGGLLWRQLIPHLNISSARKRTSRLMLQSEVITYTLSTLATTISFLESFFSACQITVLRDENCVLYAKTTIFSLKLNKYQYLYPFEVVDRGSETQIHVDKK